MKPELQCKDKIKEETLTEFRQIRDTCSGYNLLRFANDAQKEGISLNELWYQSNTPAEPLSTDDVNLNQPDVNYDQPFMDWYMEEKGKDPDNIFPPPLPAQKAVDFLRRYLLGEDYYVVDPISTEQCNTRIVYTILERYSKRFKQEIVKDRWQIFQPFMNWYVGEDKWNLFQDFTSFFIDAKK